MRNMCKSIVGMADINVCTNEVGLIKLLVLPSVLQQKFLRYVHAVRKQKHEMPESARKLDTLFTRLQYRAFSGKLWSLS